MRNLKRLATLFLSAALSLTLALPVFAAESDTGFEDVDASAWFAQEAVWCRDNGVMNGTSDSTFSPDRTMTRGMLATVLYRAAGSPAVTGSPSFSDVPSSSAYANGVAWAAANGIVTGYGDGRFGLNAPVTRQQIAAILWRYDGSETVETAASFTDSASISSYAAHAVNWAAANGIIAGRNDGSFDPTGNATRAQVAVILYRYLTGTASQTPDQGETPEDSANILIAYFSCTGNTESIANHLDSILDADVYEITPEVPYTDADLNYGDPNSRTSIEMNDPNARPAISEGVENMEDYDIIFLGYPIWWGDAPRIISTFLESYDFSGKTIIPFCTSGSSGIGSSASDLEALTEGATWLDGQRFSGNASEATVESWVNGLDIELPMAA